LHAPADRAAETAPGAAAARVLSGQGGAGAARHRLARAEAGAAGLRRPQPDAGVYRRRPPRRPGAGPRFLRGLQRRRPGAAVPRADVALDAAVAAAGRYAVAVAGGRG